MFVIQHGVFYMNYQSASILPFSQYNGENYYYFAVERNGKLSTFGGKRDAADHHHPSVTARREFHEESNDVFGSKNRVKNIFKTHVLKTIYNNKYKHVCFVMPVKAWNYNPIKKFKKINSQNPNNEIVGIIAVRQSTLRNAIKQENWTLQGHKIRHCARETLRLGLKKGAV